MTAKDFLENIPGNINAANMPDLNTVLHFDFGENQQYTISAVAGKGEFKEGLNGNPECVIKTNADDFVKIAKGEMNPMMAVMMGKMKVTNPTAMMKYTKILGLM